MKNGLAIIGFIAVFVSVVFANGYPAELPENYANAPQKMLCERSTPTAIHIRDYINRADGWIVTIRGRNGQDSSITILNFNNIGTVGKKYDTHFFYTAKGWKLVDDMSKEEIEKWYQTNPPYDEEEGRWLGNCFATLRTQRAK